MRFSIHIVALVAMLLGLLAAPVRAGEKVIVLVVHPQSPVKDLPLSEVRNIFLGKMKSWPAGETIVPLYLVPTSPTSAAFAEKALGKSLDDLEKYWIDARIRGGAKKPRTLPSGAVARRLVASLSNAIGYVLLDEVDGSVRVLKIDGKDANTAGYPLRF